MGGRQKDRRQNGKHFYDLVLLHVEDPHRGLLEIAHLVMLEGNVVLDPLDIRRQFVDPSLELDLGKPIHFCVEVAHDPG